MKITDEVESVPDVFKGLPLDDFQKEAITGMLQQNSVIVAAPTGAGKTLIAEFLIEYALSRGEKIVYTAPIKALSSQKFRDFSEDYGYDVGILTGDVVINRQAPVRMMTTEIFRNMLLEDSEELDYVKYVIFDEVHYLSDIDRGTVWEESIIFAPDHMRFLCLSATIPNVKELALWIETLKKHNVKIINNIKRPVPLKHFAFFPETKKTILVSDLKIRGKNFNNQRIDFFNRKKKAHTNHLDLIRHLKNNEQMPLIFFLFSRLKCFDYAKLTCKVFDFTSLDEKNQIKNIFNSIVYDNKIRSMKNTCRLYDYLKKGIAVHNAGLLPVLKELVEVMFCKGLVKVLYCTETFALGINMPAKAVAFDSVRKYDGRDFRNLTTREYYQMAGRAGRRGMDNEGFVYSILTGEKDEILDIKNIVLNPVEHLESQFSLSYNTVLNLLKINDMSKIEKVLSFNFGQFHLNRTISVKNDEFLKLSEWKKKNFCKKGQISVSSFGKYLKNRKKINIICENMIEDYKYGILKSGKKLSRGRIRDIRKQFMKKLGILQCPSCTFYKSCKEEYIDNTNKFNNIRKLVSNYSDKIHLAQFEKKINFLEELGYLDKNNIPTSRGEMASRIHGHEIVITEMFFSGLFEKAEAYEIACFVTSVIYEKRRNDKVGKFNVPEDIYIKLEKFSKSLEFFKKIEKKYKLSTIENLDITMIPVTYFWAKGLEFEEIIKITNLEEGDLIRTLRRVIDMLRQILSAVIDLPGTNDKIRNAIKLIKRSVVDPENDF